MEPERFEPRLFPARVDAAAQDAGIGRPLGVAGTRKEEPVARVVEQDEMVGKEDGELVDDRYAARLSRLRGDELLGPAIPAPVNMNRAAIEIDGGKVERKHLAQRHDGVER